MQTYNDLFPQPYHQNNFIDFINDFCPTDVEDVTKSNILTKDTIFTKATILGYSKSLGLYILEIEHNKEDPRITITKEAFKLLVGQRIRNAIISFYNPNSSNWRLSYLTITLKEDDNNIVYQYSNTKRYSFFLGKEAKIKTPTQHLIEKGRVKDLDDLLSRFNIEVVNTEFYKSINDSFQQLYKHTNLILPKDNDTQTHKVFALRLIGRLVFCWFLKQKKTHQGESLLPDAVLSSQAVDSFTNKNYYECIIEPLFFEVLNTSSSHRSKSTLTYIPNPNSIPYLNGGLFTPQEDDYYDRDKNSKSKLRIENSWFSNFFKVLEEYNFTIDENSAIDEELSIDPEMLGRIFENLLAEINPETGDSARKATGSFYTPRTIVDYMVNQSLLEYFTTHTNINASILHNILYNIHIPNQDILTEKEKQDLVSCIYHLKILDPACGSGAFPIGILQKLVFLLNQLDPNCRVWIDTILKAVDPLYKQSIQDSLEKESSNYIRKLDIIKRCIFGVDIQPIAIEISRLRCFLTLMVDTKADATKENLNITPLPNLEFKFVCANTLIRIPSSNNNGVENDVFQETTFQDSFLNCVQNYYNQTGNDKENTKKEIIALIQGEANTNIKSIESQIETIEKFKKIGATEAKTIAEKEKQLSPLKQKKELWESYLNLFGKFQNKTVGFFDTPLFFPSVTNGFDIVIGNPPVYTTSKTKRK